MMGMIVPSLRIQNTLLTLIDRLNCVEFSDDTTLIAGGFAESYVRLWSATKKPLKSIIPSENAPTGLPTSRKLVGHSGPVFNLSFSPDARYLISASEDKSCRLWSLDTYTALVVYKGHDSPVWDVKFGPYGHYFATASYDHTARLWSCDHIYPLRIFAGHVSDVDHLAWHPNSAYLFTGSSDKTARMWDIATGNSVRLFAGHTAPVTALAVSPNGKYLATAAEDSIINLWDIAAGKRIKAMRGHGKTSIYSLSFSQDNKILVSGGADMSVRCWDVLHGTGSGNADGPEPMANVGGGDATTKVEGAGTTAGRRKGGKDVVATYVLLIPPIIDGNANTDPVPIILPFGIRRNRRSIKSTSLGRIWSLLLVPFFIHDLFLLFSLLSLGCIWDVVFGICDGVMALVLLCPWSDSFSVE